MRGVSNKHCLLTFFIVVAFVVCGSLFCVYWCPLWFGFGSNHVAVCVLYFCLMVLWVGLQSVIVTFPGHTHLLFVTSVISVVERNVLRQSV